MKVTMLISVSSVDASYGSGQEYDLPDLLAKQWIKAGLAEASEEVESEEPAPEPVVEEKPAAAPAPAPRRRGKAAPAPKSDLL